MPGAHEQDVALTHLQPLLALRRLQLLTEYVLARLEPVDPA